MTNDHQPVERRVAPERIWISPRQAELYAKAEYLRDPSDTEEYVRAALVHRPPGVSERCGECGHDWRFRNQAGICEGPSSSFPAAGQICGCTSRRYNLKELDKVLAEAEVTDLVGVRLAELELERMLKADDACTGATTPPAAAAEGECEHGVKWSMECLSCGPSDYIVAPTAATAGDAAQDDTTRTATCPNCGWYLSASKDFTEAFCERCEFSRPIQTPPSTIAPGEGARLRLKPEAWHCQKCATQLLFEVNSYSCDQCKATWPAENIVLFAYADLTDEMFVFPLTEPTQAGVEAAADAIIKAWMWHTPEHDQKRARTSIIHFISKHCAAPVKAGEVERLKKELAQAYYEDCEICEQVIVSENGDKVYTFIVCGRCWNKKQQELHDARRTTIQSCIDIVNNASTIPFAGVAYVDRDQVVRKLDALVKGEENV